MENQDIVVALAKMQVTQEQILQEIKDLKPRVAWLETKAYYAMGFLTVVAIFSDTILKKLGLK